MRGQTGKEEGTTRAGSNAARGSACRPFGSGTAHRHAGTEVWEPAPGHGSHPTGAPPPAVPPHWTGGREVLGREGRGAGYAWRQPPPSTNPQGSCQHAPVTTYTSPACGGRPAVAPPPHGSLFPGCGNSAQYPTPHRCNTWFPQKDRLGCGWKGLDCRAARSALCRTAPPSTVGPSHMAEVPGTLPPHSL